MVSVVVAPRPSMSTASASTLERVGLATCPSCHTQDQGMTHAALSAGSDWQCPRCGSQWNARRLATVAAYAVWQGEHPDSMFVPGAVKERSL